MHTEPMIGSKHRWENGSDWPRFFIDPQTPVSSEKNIIAQRLEFGAGDGTLFQAEESENVPAFVYSTT